MGDPGLFAMNRLTGTREGFLNAVIRGDWLPQYKSCDTHTDDSQENTGLTVRTIL